MAVKKSNPKARTSDAFFEAVVKRNLGESVTQEQLNKLYKKWKKGAAK